MQRKKREVSNNLSCTWRHCRSGSARRTGTAVGGAPVMGGGLSRTRRPTGRRRRRRLAARALSPHSLRLVTVTARIPVTTRSRVSRGPGRSRPDGSGDPEPDQLWRRLSGHASRSGSRRAVSSAGQCRTWRWRRMSESGGPWWAIQSRQART